MTNLRAAAAILLVAPVLGACETGTSATDDASPSQEAVDLAQVRETCMTETAETLKVYTDELTGGQFFELSADGETLQMVTPAPVQEVTRAVAHFASQCAFREAGAPADLVDRLAVPASGEQSGGWTGFTGTWESDAEQGFRASVKVAH